MKNEHVLLENNEKKNALFEYEKFLWMKCFDECVINWLIDSVDIARNTILFPTKFG